MMIRYEAVAILKTMREMLDFMIVCRAGLRLPEFERLVLLRKALDFALRGESGWMGWAGARAVLMEEFETLNRRIELIPGDAGAKGSFRRAVLRRWALGVVLGVKLAVGRKEAA